MSDPKWPFEAAVRAGLNAWSYEGSRTSYEACQIIVKAAFAAALPPDPAPETIDNAAQRIRHESLPPKAPPQPPWLELPSPVRDLYRKYAVSAYRDFRASLLPGEEPS